MRNAEASGSTHYGVLVYLAEASGRVSTHTIGLYVRVLDATFLSRHSPEDAMLNSYGWLPDRPL